MAEGNGSNSIKTPWQLDINVENLFRVLGGVTDADRSDIEVQYAGKSDEQLEAIYTQARGVAEIAAEAATVVGKLLGYADLGSFNPHDISRIGWAIELLSLLGTSAREIESEAEFMFREPPERRQMWAQSERERLGLAT
ncbi:MAG: hypothetical protein ACT4PG_12395 [Panacagrimonas sp.]